MELIEKKNHVKNSQFVKPRSDFDGPWKKILTEYFEDFVSLCLPEVYKKINWQMGYQALDKELEKISRRAVLGKRFVDKLIKVYLHDGGEIWVLCHIEVQAKKDKRFSERMFVYRSRLYDLHAKPILSIALLIDNNIHWRPNQYIYEFLGCRIEMNFIMIKLLDFRHKIKNLELSNNRFAAVILAQLTALEKTTIKNKLDNKINLTKALYNRGWSKQNILDLYEFIDWVLVLPSKFELEYEQDIESFEKELNVEYVTTAERIGLQRGLSRGLAQGISEGLAQGVILGEKTLLIKMLECKFYTIPSQYLEKIADADAEKLLFWGEKILHAKTLEEVFI